VERSGSNGRYVFDLGKIELRHATPRVASNTMVRPYGDGQATRGYHAKAKRKERARWQACDFEALA
jgi:hypothetical protein